MKQSNLYVVGYAAALTLVCGSLLALAATGLKPFIDANKLQEKQSNILSTVMSTEGDFKTEEVFKQRVKKSYITNKAGKTEEVENKEALAVDISKEYKKPAAERKLPVFEVFNKEGTAPEYYVFPVFGFGLWDNIWGYVALESDLNTIKGVSFDHKGETPGLGARIADDEIQKRYEGKKIFDGQTFEPVAMQKGEGNDYKGQEHKVDGMSGATITGKGLNKMMKDYFELYMDFIKSKKK